MTIVTKLIKDGNSTAVRLPKTLLDMSGLSGVVELKASKGSITVSKVSGPRANWAKKIQESNTTTTDKELSDWDTTLRDGLEDED